MGIKSTMTISRDAAICRIETIQELILLKDYRGLESTTTETSHSISVFIDEGIVPADFSKWTNKMLEDQMDKPYYRHSMFDNYHVRGEE